MSNTTSNVFEPLDPELAQELIDTPLPDGWELRAQHVDGESIRYYAGVPGTAVMTTAHLDPEKAAQLAHEKHQDHINKYGEPPRPDGGTTGHDAEKPAPPEPEVPERVYNEEKDDWVAIRPEGRELFDFVSGFVQVSTIVRGLAFRAIREHEYFLHGGHSSFSEYCDNAAPVSRTTVYRDIKRAEQFSDFMPDVFSPKQVQEAIDAGRSPFELLRSSDDKVPKQLSRLSTGKVNLLSGLSDEQRQSYMEEGVIRLEGGEELTIEDIRAETVKELRGKFEKQRKAQKRKLEEVEERALKAESERDALAEQLDEERERIEAARDLEDHYGAAHSKLQEKRRVMEEVRTHLDEAIQLLPKVGITPDDPEADQENLIELLQRIHRLQDVFNADYAEVRMHLGI